MDKGQHLRLIIEDTSTTPALATFVAMSTDLSLHLSATTEDSTTKDSTDTNGLWNESEVTTRSGDIQFSALVAIDTTASVGSTSQYLEDFIDKVSDTPISWKIVFVSGANNRTVGKILCSGQGKLTNLQVSAQNRQKTTYSGTVNIYGPVTVGTN